MCALPALRYNIYVSFNSYYYCTLFCSVIENQESGTVVLAMDALFGLPRKKSAGSSHRDALHGDLFFGNQAAVDEHVASYKTKKIDSVGVTVVNSSRFH